MARKTKAEAEKTRLNILEAALDVFSSKGYSRSTFVDIAESIGLTKGAVYWHFKNKEELLFGLLEHGHNERLTHRVDPKEVTLEKMRTSYLLKAQKIFSDEKTKQFEYFCAFQIEWPRELPNDGYQRLLTMRDACILGIKTNFEILKTKGEIAADIDIGMMCETLGAVWKGSTNQVLMGITTPERHEEVMRWNFDRLTGYQAK